MSFFKINYKLLEHNNRRKGVIQQRGSLLMPHQGNNYGICCRAFHVQSNRRAEKVSTPAENVVLM